MGTVISTEMWDRAEQLAHDGKNYVEIARELRVSEAAIRRDMRVRRARASIAPNAHREQSLRHLNRTAACIIEPAHEAISEIDTLLRRIGNLYTLAPVDRRHLISILDKHIERLEK